MKGKAIKDMNFPELQDECRDKGLPYKDASSAEELRKRLASKKSAKK